ncbi:MAG: hypothetical protein M1812_004813 [Candelaria pacifica]|nr:MAG: hypothetical protein M1812_004813 [Candelaria pacifica]
MANSTVNASRPRGRPRGSQNVQTHSAALTLESPSSNYSTKRKSTTRLSNHVQELSSIFPFMRLPGELRNKVYEYALIRTIVYPYNIKGPENSSHLHQVNPPSVQLLAVCRQISHEAGHLCYLDTIFSFSSHAHLARFLLACHGKATLIQNIELVPTVSYTPSVCAISVLRQLLSEWIEVLECLFQMVASTPSQSLKLYRVNVTDLLSTDFRPNCWLGGCLAEMGTKRESINTEVVSLIGGAIHLAANNQDIREGLRSNHNHLVCMISKMKLTIGIYRKLRSQYSTSDFNLIANPLRPAHTPEYRKSLESLYGEGWLSWAPLPEY